MKKGVKRFLSAMLLVALLALAGGGLAESGEMRKLTIMGAVDQQMWDTRENQAAWQAYLEMLAAINIELEFEAIAADQYPTVLTTRTASGDLPDLVMINSMDDATAINLGNAGIFQDVLPLVEQYSNGNWKNIAETFSINFWGAITTPNGNAYYLPGWNTMTGNDDPFFSLMVPLIRYDWLEKAGLAMPTNIDEFSAALKAFRELDVNGNGEQDEVMVFNPIDFQFVAPFFGLPPISSTTLVQIDPSDDTAKSPWLMKDELVNYLTWLQDMYASGVLCVDAIGENTAEFVDSLIKQNKVSCQMGFALTNFYDLSVAEYGGSYVGVVAPANGDASYVMGAPNLNFASKLAITKNCKDVQAAIDLFDMYNTEAFYTLYRFGVEGVSHTVENGMVMPVADLGNRDFDLSGKACLATLAGNMIPGLRIEKFEQFFNTLGADPAIAEIRKDLGLSYSTFGSGKKIYAGPYGDFQMAMMSEETTQRRQEISIDLVVYSAETLAKYALGEYDIADLDKYVDQMKAMGLEELVSIYQEAHDLYLAAK